MSAGAATMQYTSQSPSNTLHHSTDSPFKQSYNAHDEQGSQLSSDSDTQVFDEEVVPADSTNQYVDQINFNTYHEPQGLEEASWVARLPGNPTPPPVQYSGEDTTYPTVPYTYQKPNELTPRSSFSDSAQGLKRSVSSIRSKSPAVLKPNTSQTRVTKASKGKTTKTPLKKASSDSVMLETLSELAKQMPEIPVRDMAAYVNRPSEVRLCEAEKKNGHIARPMNAFLLYRSAYTECAREWSSQNNHQEISKVAGASWKNETEEIKKKYKDLSELETTNHKLSFPQYKFKPKKNDVIGPKKGRGSDSGYDEDEDDEYGDSEPGDWDYKPRGERSARVNGVQRHRIKTEYPDSSPVLSNIEEEMSFQPTYGANRSSWDMPNFGRPVQPVYPMAGFQPQYFQMAIQPNMSTPSMEDIRQRQVGTPESFSYGGIPSGVPGSHSADLLHSQSNTPVPVEQQLDPTLMENFENGGFAGMNTNFNPAFGGVFMYPGDSYVLANTTSQFDDWMEQHG